jgi:hypothetical protein
MAALLKIIHKVVKMGAVEAASAAEAALPLVRSLSCASSLLESGGTSASCRTFSASFSSSSTCNPWVCIRYAACGIAMLLF